MYKSVESNKYTDITTFHAKKIKSPSRERYGDKSATGVCFNNAGSVERPGEFNFPPMSNKAGGREVGDLQSAFDFTMFLLR